MIENNPNNVSSAFEMLLEEVEAEIGFVNGVGSKAFDGRDYDKAMEALERTGTLIAFREKVAGLRKEWEEMATAAERDEDEEARAELRDLGRLRSGQRTPEAKYFIPILRVLEEMGGRGKVAKVIDRTGQAMKLVLKQVDYTPLTSGPGTPRWRNTAQWARNIMVREGLLKGDLPRGVWEITDKGRARLMQSR
jgi:hypothetical protein